MSIIEFGCATSDGYFWQQQGPWPLVVFRTKVSSQPRARCQEKLRSRPAASSQVISQQSVYSASSLGTQAVCTLSNKQQCCLPSLFPGRSGCQKPPITSTRVTNNPHRNPVDRDGSGVASAAIAMACQSRSSKEPQHNFLLDHTPNPRIIMVRRAVNYWHSPLR